MNTANVAYEHALLGCVLFDNRVLDEYAITTDFFTAPENVEIWGEIMRARASGAEANIREIALRMPDKALKIAELTDCMTSANVGMYYSELKESLRARKLVDMMRGTSARMRDGLKTTDLIEYIEKSLTDLSDSADSGYKHASAYMPEFIKTIENAYANRGKLTGIDTGIEGLNGKTNGWQRQTMTIIGARPGTGKTALALKLASAALRTQKRVGIFSAEMDAVSIIKRMVADWGNVSHTKMNSGFLGDTDILSITDAAGEIAATNLYISDAPAIDLPLLVSESRRMRRKDKVDVIFVDYLSLITNPRHDIPRHEQVAEISARCKQLSRELNIPLVVLAQLNRCAEGERPNKSHLRDSGNIEQDADIIILLHDLGFTDAERTVSKINMIIDKQRNGPVGDIPLAFNPSRMSFKEMDRPWEEQRGETRRKSA